MRSFKPHALHWIVEPLIEEPSYEEKAMFGCRGCYLHGRLSLVLAWFKEEPWRGLLIPTERERHEALLRDFPDLLIHPVLGKWLYLPEDHEDFEESAARIVARVLRNDERFGVVPKPKKRKRKRTKTPASLSRKAKR